MKTEKDQDMFNFVIIGTAHAIVVSMVVTFGTPNKKFINDLSKKIDNSFLDSKKLFLNRDNYTFCIEHSPEFNDSLIDNLK